MKRMVIESVDVLEENSRVNFPKLVRFATGSAIPDGAKFASFQSASTGQQVLTAKTERMSYGNTCPPDHLYLAAVNRTSGTCRLMSLPSYHLCPVPIMSAAEAVAPAADSETAGSDQLAGSQPTATDVGRVFGLARWKKRHNRSVRLRVAGDTLAVGEQLDAAVKETAVPFDVGAAASSAGHAAQPSDAATKDGSGGDQEILTPPCNWLACVREDVYCRDDVIPPHVWRHLVKNTDHFNQQLLKNEAQYPYIRERVTSLCGDADQDRYIMVSYAFYMLRLLKYMRARMVRMSWKQLAIPDPVLRHLREQFMERSHNGWDRSDRLIDKLICYFLVLAVWIHRYSLDLSSMAGAVGISVKKVGKYASSLGMAVTGSSAVLRIPLFKRPQTTSRRMFSLAAM